MTTIRVFLKPDLADRRVHHIGNGGVIEIAGLEGVGATVTKSHRNYIAAQQSDTLQHALRRLGYRSK